MHFLAIANRWQRKYMTLHTLSKALSVSCTCTMGFLTHEQKSRILRLQSNGKGPSEIVRILAEDDVKISRWSIIRFLRRFQERKSLENATKPGRPSLGVTIELMNFIDAEMESNEELTSPKLARRILVHFGVQFSQEKVRHLHRKLGWVQTGTKYTKYP